MRLKILSVAYPFAPVTPSTAGGAEQVLAQLDRALVEAGHESLVIAAEGSDVAGSLYAVPRIDGVITDDDRMRVWEQVRRAIARALDGQRIDLVHFHGIDFHEYSESFGIPALVTLHLPPDWYPAAIFDDVSPQRWLHCVSVAQQGRCPPASALLPPIPNGVDLSRYSPAIRKRGYLFSMGRICPEKGFEHALDAAAKAAMPLVLAGEVYPYETHQRYFRDEIIPRLDSSRRFIGAVGPDRKRRLLAGAKAVLIPSLAAETSSLVAMEAAASGTPVIAFPSGALAEIVRDGRTGFLVSDSNEMADAIGRVGEIDPRHCREHAEQNFDATRTVSQYFSVYSRLISRFEILSSAEALHALESEWADLFERCPDAPPFLHPAWQLAWWDIFGSAEIHTIAMRRQNRLAALAACFVYEGRLVFIGNGISDRLGILAEDDAAAQLMVDKLGETRLDLQEIPEGSPLLRFTHEPVSVCPTVDLREPVPKNMARNVKRACRDLEQRGAFTFIHSTRPDLTDELFQLHTARWRADGQPGVLNDDRTWTFHRAASEGLSRAGMLRMHAIASNTSIIGVVYAFARNGTVYSYLGGFDPELRDYSPGAVSIHAAMDHARRQGDHFYDFLRGAEKYKYFWGATDRIQYRVLT